MVVFAQNHPFVGRQTTAQSKGLCRETAHGHRISRAKADLRMARIEGGARQDGLAMRAALTCPWSNGKFEGQTKRDLLRVQGRRTGGRLVRESAYVCGNESGYVSAADRRPSPVAAAHQVLIQLQEGGGEAVGPSERSLLDGGVRLLPRFGALFRPPAALPTAHGLLRWE
jgi:hypothetical protein